MVLRTPSVLWLLVLMLIAAAGCKKHAPASNTTSGTPPSQEPTAAAAPVRGPPPAPPPTTPVVVPASDNVTATLGQLSLELRKYVVRTRSVPKNFEEFVAKSRVQPPPAPPGKKYAIQGQAVVLVKL